VAEYATASVDNGPNGTANMIARPRDAWPQTPKGFKVELHATDLKNLRLVRTAPNGDLFLADSETGKILVFRDVTSDGKARQTAEFATGLAQPFGIAFSPPGPDPKWIYVGNTGEIPVPERRPERLVARRRNWPTCPAEAGCALAVTGPATSSSPRTEQGCSSLGRLALQRG